MKLIDKDALVAEIERLLKCDKLYKSEDVETRNSVLDFILSFLDTLEVKDLELAWEDLVTIEKLGDDLSSTTTRFMSDEEFYKEVLKRFKAQKG